MKTTKLLVFLTVSEEGGLPPSHKVDVVAGLDMQESGVKGAEAT